MVKLIHLLFLLFCFCSTYQKFLSSGGGNGQRRALNLPPRNGSRRPIPGKKEEKKEYSTGLLPKPKK